VTVLLTYSYNFMTQVLSSSKHAHDMWFILAGLASNWYLYFL